MSTFNAAKANEKKKRSTYEKFKNSVGQEEVEEEPLLVWINHSINIIRGPIKYKKIKNCPYSFWVFWN